jgi:hypothetical protein
MHLEATYGCDVETIASVIERSDIVVNEPVECLPEGYEQVDVAVLHWIAAEARRARLARH